MRARADERYRQLTEAAGGGAFAVYGGVPLPRPVRLVLDGPRVLVADWLPERAAAWVVLRAVAHARLVGPVLVDTGQPLPEADAAVEAVFGKPGPLHALRGCGRGRLEDAV